MTSTGLVLREHCNQCDEPQLSAKLSPVCVQDYVLRLCAYHVQVHNTGSAVAVFPSCEVGVVSALLTVKVRSYSLCSSSAVLTAI